MHLLESQSLCCGGATIDKIDIYPKYFPIIYPKYITLQTTSKQSKTYDFWQEVVDIILPVLDQHNIKIIHFGGKDDVRVNGVIDLCGQTSINQCAYVISNSMGHLGVDSFGTHLAGSYDKPLVSLYSNNYIDCVKPYFGDKAKQILLEPDREGFGKPNFSLEEHPKTINTIKPETIASSILSVLGLEYKHPYQSVFIGDHYNKRCIENVPNQVIDPRQLSIDHVIERMDLFFHEEILVRQLSMSKCAIVTDKLINLNIIKQFRNNIQNITFFVNSETDPKILQEYQYQGVEVILISKDTEENINKLRLKFADVGVINKQHSINFLEIPSFKNIDKSKLYYKSNKFVLSSGKIYQSDAAYKNDLPIGSFENNFQKLTDNLYPEIFYDSLFFYILTDKDLAAKSAI